MKIDYAREAQNYEKYSLPTLGTWVWEACCRKYGLGGTPEASRAYEKIMASVFFELDIPFAENKLPTKSKKENN